MRANDPAIKRGCTNYTYVKTGNYIAISLESMMITVYLLHSSIGFVEDLEFEFNLRKKRSW